MSDIRSGDDNVVNTWPDEIKRAMHQDEHEAWNAKHYPGTRQLCCICDEPTGRCEEDSMHIEGYDGPVCESCYFERGEHDL